MRARDAEKAAVVFTLLQGPVSLGEGLHQSTAWKAFHNVASAPLAVAYEYKSTPKKKKKLGNKIKRLEKNNILSE